MVVAAFKTVELAVRRAEAGLRDQGGEIGGGGVAQSGGKVLSRMAAAKLRVRFSNSGSSRAECSAAAQASGKRVQ